MCGCVIITPCAPASFPALRCPSLPRLASADRLGGSGARGAGTCGDLACLASPCLVLVLAASCVMRSVNRERIRIITLLSAASAAQASRTPRPNLVCLLGAWGPGDLGTWHGSEARRGEASGVLSGSHRLSSDLPAGVLTTGDRRQLLAAGQVRWCQQCSSDASLGGSKVFRNVFAPAAVARTCSMQPAARARSLAPCGSTADQQRDPSRPSHARQHYPHSPIPSISAAAALCTLRAPHAARYVRCTIRTTRTSAAVSRSSVPPSARSSARTYTRRTRRRMQSRAGRAGRARTAVAPVPRLTIRRS